MAKKNTDKIVFDHIKVLDAAAKGISVAKAPDEKVILCYVLPPFDFSWATGLQPAEMVVSLNKSIKNMPMPIGFLSGLLFRYGK